jgi:hypothetical protein
VAGDVHDDVHEARVAHASARTLHRNFAFMLGNPGPSSTGLAMARSAFTRATILSVAVGMPADRAVARRRSRAGE